MRKIMKRLISMTLLVTILTGCGSGGNGKETDEIGQIGQGYDEYVLSQIDGAGRIFAMKEAGESYIVLGGSSEGRDVIKFTSADEGLNWTQEETKAESLLPEGAFISAADIDGSDNLIVGYGILSDGSIRENKIVRVSPDQTEAEELADYGDQTISGLKYSSDCEAVYALVDGDLHKFDITGKEIYTVNVPGLLDFCETDDSLMALTENALYIYDRETGKLSGEDTWLNEAMADEISKTSAALGADTLSCKNLLKPGADGSGMIYLMLATGIYSYVAEGSLSVQMVQDTDNNFQKNTTTIYDYIVDAKNSQDNGEVKFVTICSGDEGIQVAAYAPYALETNIAAPEEAVENPYADEPEAAITVYSLRYAEFMEGMIGIFEGLHPNITVEYRYGIDDESGISAEDAVNALNTELLAGEGPDVILMDGLNVWKYTESGVLLELSDVYDAILQENPNCLENVIAAYRTDEGIYAIPSRFRFPALVGSKDEIASITDIKSLTEYIRNSEKPNEGNDLNIYDWEVLFDILYPAYSADMIDVDGNYHEEELETFLADFKELWDALQEHSTEEEMQQWLSDVEEDSRKAQAVWQMYPLYNQEYSGQKIALCQFETVGDITQFYSIKYNGVETGVENENINYDYKIFGNGEKNVFIPSVTFAINANSDEKEAAGSFIREMFGNEIQKTTFTEEPDYKQGNAVNLDGLAGFQEDMTRGGATPGAAAEDYGGQRIAWYIYFRQEGTMEEYMDVLRQLNAPANDDIRIRHMIKEGISAYMEDGESLDSTMDHVGQYIELYISE